MAALLALWDQADPGFTFVDVGANMGLYAAVCARLFEPGAVVAVEPTPTTAAVARQVIRSNRLDVRVEEVALGSKEGTADLYLSAKSEASNSLVEGFKKSTGTVSVPVELFDGFVEREGLVPDVVKIDVETFEPQVIAGARRMLETIRPSLVVEVLRRRGHDHGEELTEAMEGLGYYYYPLDDEPSWQARDRIRGRKGGQNQDWLLTPEPLDAEFGFRVSEWSRAVAVCTADRNGRLPILPVVRGVYQADGVAGLARGVRNRIRRLIRES